MASDRTGRTVLRTSVSHGWPHWRRWCTRQASHVAAACLIAAVACVSARPPDVAPPEGAPPPAGAAASLAGAAASPAGAAASPAGAASSASRSARGRAGVADLRRHRRQRYRRRGQYNTGRQLFAAYQRQAFPLVIMVGDNIYGSERPQDFVKKFEAALPPAARCRRQVLREPRQPRLARTAVLQAIQHGGQALLQPQSARAGRPVLRPRQHLSRYAPARMAGERAERVEGALEDSLLSSPAVFVGRQAWVGPAPPRGRWSRCSSSTASPWSSPATTTSTSASGRNRASPISWRASAGKLARGDLRDNSPLMARGFDTDLAFMVVEHRRRSTDVSGDLAHWHGHRLGEHREAEGGVSAYCSKCKMQMRQSREGCAAAWSKARPLTPREAPARLAIASASQVTRISPAPSLRQRVIELVRVRPVRHDDRHGSGRAPRARRCRNPAPP